jgi:hypothetical protein
VLLLLLQVLQLVNTLSRKQLASLYVLAFPYMPDAFMREWRVYTQRMLPTDYTAARGHPMSLLLQMSIPSAAFPSKNSTSSLLVCLLAGTTCI